MKNLKRYQYKNQTVLAVNKPEAAFKFMLFTATDLEKVKKVSTVKQVRKVRKCRKGK